MSQLEDILEHSRRREKELTVMAERLLTWRKDAGIAALRAGLEETERLLTRHTVLYEAKPTDEDKMIEGTWDPSVIESDWPLMTCPDCETTVDWSGIDPEEVQMEMDCPECGAHWEAELVFRVQIQHPMQIIDARSGRAAGGAADPHPTIGPAYMQGQ